MGICLDTDQQNGSQVFDEGDARSVGRWRGEAGLLATPPDGHFPMQNVGPVKFEAPKVPVIFVLGGPGSGKVTHCDNLMQEKKGITHINMTDLLQQYALGNESPQCVDCDAWERYERLVNRERDRSQGEQRYEATNRKIDYHVGRIDPKGNPGVVTHDHMQDFSLLSSRTVAEVLMLEMKMSPGAKTFLVSGYPRNMRDVVEYSEKIQIVNGVVLVSWRQEVLERQIDYGAQLGHVVLGLARMELRNFYRNVMPVAEYFDRTGILLEVNGERNPSEVYLDFREAILRILGLAEDNVRDKQPQRSLKAEVEVERHDITSNSSSPNEKLVVSEISPRSPIARVNPAKTANKPRKGIPTFIWVIGGPGSNKSNLCTQAVRNMPGWVHVSIGGLLRTMASSNTIVNEAIVSGEMAPQDIVMQLIEQQVLLNRDNDGIIIDGFPRDLNQVQEFESKFGQEPPLVLLDCSKLQLGRGRLDDSVSAFRKRLELFREVSLPMLKTIDNENRLTIVDGDTDVPSVQQECAAALYQLMRRARRKEEDIRGPLSPPNSSKDPNSQSPNKVNGGQHIPLTNGVAKHIIENGVNALANHVEKTIGTKNTSRTNGVINNVRQQNGITHKNGAANGANGAQHMLQNGIAHLANGNNRVAPSNFNPDNSKDPLRNMYNEVEGYRQDLHI